MSIIDPLTCGFVKVAGYVIFTEQQHLQRNPGECAPKFYSRQLMQKYNTFRELFKDARFELTYKQFLNNFPKIVPNIGSLGKKDIKKKNDVL